MWVTDGEGNRVQVYPPGATTPNRTLSGVFSFPCGVSVSAAGVGFISDDRRQQGVRVQARSEFTVHATVTNGLNLPTGVLAAKP